MHAHAIAHRSPVSRALVSDSANSKVKGQQQHIKGHCSSCSLSLQLCNRSKTAKAVASTMRGEG